MPKLDSAPKSPSRGNSFAALAELEEVNEKEAEQQHDNNNVPSKVLKPPPIYLREQSSSALVSTLSSIVGSNFYIVPIKKGNISETKIQINSENHYRSIIAFLDKAKKNYYTYQLKSSKGLEIIIKGIESDVDPNEIKAALVEAGFEVKTVFNIKNKDKIPQPMFRVELEPDCKKLKRNECHPIYNIRYLLHRRITIDEPFKRTGPIQCMNCQEYGHTKSYCTLRPVCVVCGELHSTINCPTDRTNTSLKKCSNCGGPHTANYRGCPVYIELKSRVSSARKELQNNRIGVKTIIPQPINTVPVDSNISYANALKGSSSSSNQSTNLENMMSNLMNCMTQFMTSMQTMMQDFIKSQNRMMDLMMSQK